MLRQVIIQIWHETVVEVDALMRFVHERALSILC